MSRRFPSPAPTLKPLESDADRIARLEQENAELKVELAAKTADVARLNQKIADGAGVRAPTEGEILAALRQALADKPSPAPSGRKAKA